MPARARFPQKPEEKCLHLVAGVQFSKKVPSCQFNPNLEMRLVAPHEEINCVIAHRAQDNQIYERILANEISRPFDRLESNSPIFTLGIPPGLAQTYAAYNL